MSKARKVKRVRVNVRPVASHYVRADERIAEFSGPNGGGGLISFQTTETGVIVDIYRIDGDVIIRTPDSNKHKTTGNRHGKCSYPACTGHLGKFPDCVTEALYSSPDWEDASTGSTEWSIYAQLFLFDEAGQTPASTTGMDHDVYVPAGTYCIITADDRGFVDRIDYPSKTLAQNAFSEIEREYHAWDEENGDN